MSARHVKRLQQLAAATTKKSLDDDASGDDAEQSTYLVRTAKPKRKGKTLELEDVHDATVTAKTRSGEAQQAPTVEVPSARDANTAQSVSADANDSKRRDEQRLAKKAEQKRRKTEKAKDDDELLDQLAVASSGAHAAAADVDARDGATSCAERAVRLLTSCDVAQLNTRAERIKSFGIDSVEDVGDSASSRRSGGGASAAAANGLFPSRPAGMQLPKFRESAFATPNRHNWPPFSSLGVVLNEKSSAKGQNSKKQQRKSQKHFVLEWHDREFTIAQQNFDDAVASMVDVNGFMERCLVRFPYHLPTLMQLRQTFAVMGDAPQSQLMLDMALYTIGVYLNRFPLGESVLDRTLPHAAAGNRLVFEVLRHGIQLAAKRGCNRTAAQLARFTLSLDATDPCALVFSLDYMLIRAREWRLLLSAYQLFEEEWTTMRRAGDSTPGASKDDSEQDTVRDRAHDVMRVLMALPGFHFGAALAKFLIEEADEQAKVSGGHKTRVGGKALPAVTDETADIVSATPDAKTLMARAMLLFPHAVWMLIEKCGIEVSTSSQPEWSHLEILRKEYESANGTSPSSAARHAAALCIERSFELWKTRDATNFLMRSALKLYSIVHTSDSQDAWDMFEIRFRRDMYASEPLLRNYKATTVADVVGETVTRIAPELLNPAAQPDELQRDARAHEAQQLAEQGYPQSELDALQRFEAVFGPLPVEVPLQQRLAMYDDMLQEYRQQLGDEMNPLSLFLRTLLPWNNLRDMALERAMHQRGVEDPARRRRARERARNEEIWRADTEAAQHAEDAASSSSDEGW